MRLPTGMQKRVRDGRTYFYARRQWRQDGKLQEEVHALGQDLELARRRFAELQARWLLVGRSAPGSVAAVARMWLDRRIPVHRPSDAGLAEQRVRKYLVPCLGDVMLHHLTPDHVRQYRLYLERQISRRRKPLSPTSVVHVLSDLRCMLLWAVESGFISSSPFPRRVMPRVQERRPKRLTDEQVDVLLTLPEPMRYIIRLGLATGGRWSELCRMRVEDVQILDGRPFIVIAHTKTGRKREVPIDPALVRGRVGLLIGPRDASVFARSVQRALQRRGHTFRFTPNLMRHTFATRLLERTGDIVAVSALLGHRVLSTTQIYAQLSNSAVYAAMHRAGMVPGRGTPEGREE